MLGLHAIEAGAALRLSLATQTSVLREYIACLAPSLSPTSHPAATSAAVAASPRLGQADGVNGGGVSEAERRSGLVASQRLDAPTPHEEADRRVVAALEDELAQLLAGTTQCVGQILAVLEGFHRNAAHSGREPISSGREPISSSRSSRAREAMRVLARSKAELSGQHDLLGQLMAHRDACA